MIINPIDGQNVTWHHGMNSIRRHLSYMIFYLISQHSFAQDFSQIYISEMMASNSATIVDQDGAYSDWIELHNPTNEELNLGGWYLSDNPENLIKWIFPPVTIEANGFLLVFASGKDLRSDELHTNFSLSSSGEWIILTKPDGKTVHFSMQFPVQYTDVSYGYVDENLMYLDQPTPGTVNVTGTFLSPPTFSVNHGLYENPFNLEISTTHTDASILYTLDGSPPDASDGISYAGPLVIDSTFIIRAVVTRGGAVSPVSTRTYIFPDKVKNQPDSLEGYPLNWGNLLKIDGVAPADYGMDPEVYDNPAYKDDLVPALKAIPTISLSTDKDNLFSHSTDPETGGIYIHTAASSGDFGEDWERAVSAEYILPDGSDGFQVNCGIRIHGGASRLPEKNPKHSFRLLFKDEYGPKKLNYDLFGGDATSSFNSLILRAGFNQTWLHWDITQRERAQYINDSWAKDIYMKMGYVATHNKYVHLYINGMYWGLYNVCERMDEDFMEYYLDGDAEDFDIIKDYAELAEGNKVAWDAMMQMAEEELSDAYSFYLLQGKDEFGNDDENKEAFLDVENLIDYMILNFYAGNKDWDHHNWVAARNRVDPGNGFQFFPWDSERIFNGKYDNIVDENNENRPSLLYAQLRHNPVFRNQFKKQANELLGPGGMLSPDSVIKVWQKRSGEIELAIIAESARWGDYRRDMHQHKNGPFDLYTKNDYWLSEQDRLVNDYFRARSQIVLGQLMDIGLAGEIVTELNVDSDQSTNNRHKSFPNPFDRSVTIQYRVQDSETVKIEVYTKEGQLMQQLYNGLTDNNLIEVNWNPGKLSQGIYFYRIATNSEVITGKMMYVW